MPLWGNVRPKVDNVHGCKIKSAGTFISSSKMYNVSIIDKNSENEISYLLSCKK